MAKHRIYISAAFAWTVECDDPSDLLKKMIDELEWHTSNHTSAITEVTITNSEHLPWEEGDPE